jgi:lipid-A-disaccharide synthase
MVAGEVSGDIHGGNLLLELRRLVPEVEAFGIGGDRLAASGLECVSRSEDLAHMGLAEVVRELPAIRRVMNGVVQAAEARRPAVAVLIDSPDFNLRLARRLGKLGIPVVLYISPQLWAWRRGRVRTIRRVAREVLCILPFEVDFYRAHRVNSRFVGHPLVDDLAREGLPDDSIARVDGRLALLPGSRGMEIRSLLPIMIDALARIGDHEVSQVILVEAPGIGEEVDAVLRRRPVDRRLKRVGGEEARRQLASCSTAWTASGTATLECAMLGVPMVVGYRLHPLTALLARLMVRVPHVALVNLIAGRRLAPELLQGRWNPDLLVSCTSDLTESKGGDQRQGLAEVRRRLGGPGASRRAAEAVADYLV